MGSKVEDSSLQPGLGVAKLSRSFPRAAASHSDAPPPGGHALLSGT